MVNVKLNGTYRTRDGHIVKCIRKVVDVTYPFVIGKTQYNHIYTVRPNGTCADVDHNYDLMDEMIPPIIKDIPSSEQFVTEERYMDIINPCMKLSLDRNAKYGAAWSQTRLSSLIDYVLMKYHRLNKMVDNPETNYNKIHSDLQDALNYAVMALMMLEKKKHLKK